MENSDPPAAVGSNVGLGPLVERLLKYSDIRRNDPRESREALRDLIVGELGDELEAVRKEERERCAKRLEELAALAPEGDTDRDALLGAADDLRRA